MPGPFDLRFLVVIAVLDLMNVLRDIYATCNDTMGAASIRTHASQSPITSAFLKRCRSIVVMHVT